MALDYKRGKAYDGWADRRSPSGSGVPAALCYDAIKRARNREAGTPSEAERQPGFFVFEKKDLDFLLPCPIQGCGC